jgi:hypothetical protein
MPSVAQLKLGGPLFLAALIIVRAKWESSDCNTGVEPPRLQSVMAFTAFNATRASAAGRKRAAVAAVRVVSSFFLQAGVVAPAGVHLDPQAPGCLGKLPSWLGQLAAIGPREGLELLSDHVAGVPKKLWAQVESEYNSGVRLVTAPLLPLSAGDLASKAALIAREVSCSVPALQLNFPVPAVGPRAPRGRFFYIAAGVGSGIAEMQQVCGCLSHSCVLSNERAVGRVHVVWCVA